MKHQHKQQPQITLEVTVGKGFKTKQPNGNILHCSLDWRPHRWTEMYDSDGNFLCIQFTNPALANACGFDDNTVIEVYKTVKSFKHLLTLTSGSYTVTLYIGGLLRPTPKGYMSGDHAEPVQPNNTNNEKLNIEACAAIVKYYDEYAVFVDRLTGMGFRLCDDTMMKAFKEFKKSSKQLEYISDEELLKLIRQQNDKRDVAIITDCLTEFVEKSCKDAVKTDGVRGSRNHKQSPWAPFFPSPQAMYPESGYYWVKFHNTGTYVTLPCHVLFSMSGEDSIIVLGHNKQLLKEFLDCHPEAQWQKIKDPVWPENGEKT
jgi:hypothetical protein